jgi:hypothetical protein
MRRVERNVLYSLAGVAAFMSVALPSLRHFLEADMARHMLLQLPLLILSGAMSHQLMQSRVTLAPFRFNDLGLSGFAFAALAISFWMVPAALDKSLASASWNVLKYLSLYVAGICIAASLQAASGPIKLFFVGNMVWMLGVIGMLYQDTTSRLCLAYLVDSQVDTGRGMVVLAFVIGAAYSATSIRGR